MANLKRKAKKIFRNTRVLILLFALFCAAIAIYPAFGREGVAIQTVQKDSGAYNAGIIVEPGVRPTAKEVITLIDNYPVKNLEDYYRILEGLEPNVTIRLETNKGVYRVVADEDGELGISVTDVSSTNIRKGLDLSGGTRATLKPEYEVDEMVLDEIVESLKLRLNTFGLSDIIVKKVTTPEQYVIVEIAGATEDEVRELVESQGKFEGVIQNSTVMTGKDIEFVGLGGTEARIKAPCPRYGDMFQCEFMFAITISEQAAEKFAEATGKLEIEGEHLSAPILLYLDNEAITNLSIVSELKGRPITNPSITGAEIGRTEREAYDNAYAEMTKLQTILESGSLPVQMNIVESQVVSPELGAEFAVNVFHVGLIAILAVGAVIFIRFRRIKITVPIMITMLSEIILLLGLAAVVGWNLDIVAIAGIIVAAGTGVDDQIVITDEVLRGETGNIYNWKEKLKRAFFIIFAAYVTTVVATVPLWWAGAGILKGFAFTTIAGVTFGVFITRPAFAAIVEVLLTD
ncbi:preprotein translocase subunit SecD [Candidatus Woesearchaeota archaeon]|nr:preprotein translocase subunit SecD [Candidatus Woesearchaeota archaeon]